jgi:hypothetical protein
MIKYAETCKVTCVDNNQTVDADILDFKPQNLLSVSLQKSIKIVLRYNNKNDEYQGEMYGRTFVTKGPKETYIRTNR